MFACTDVAFDVLPVLDLLNSYESGDSEDMQYAEECDEPVWCGPLGPVLEEKREDYHYDDVVESLRTNGFTKGIRIHPTYRRVIDGHHRLTAAIDLGLRYVPVETHAHCDTDSGGWG